MTSSTTVPTVALGDGLVVSAQGYGGMSLTDVYGPVTDDDALRTLTHAVDSGATFVDTANIYGGGRSETIIARLLRTRREEVQLASKFGIVAAGGIGKREINGRPEYVREQIDGSLRRLGTDHLDLYYQHRPDPKVPIEETVGAMSELVTAGKVLHLGLSEATGQEVRRANAVHPIAAVQSEWSIVSRDVERFVIPTLVELGIGFVPYSPVSRALLTGAFDAEAMRPDDGRHSFPRFAPDAVAANAPLVDELREIAQQMRATPAQVALAWLYAHADRSGLAISPIPGTRFVDRVTENLGALDVTLPDEALAALDTFAARVTGGRSFNPSWVSEGREG